MMTRQQLIEMSQSDIQSMKKESLVDIQNIHINPALPKEQRIEMFLEQIHNPYCFRCGDTGVKIEFADNAVPLQDLLTRLLIRKKSNLQI